MGKQKLERVPRDKDFDPTLKKEIEARNTEKKKITTLHTTLIDQANLPTVIGLNYFDLIPDAGIL